MFTIADFAERTGEMVALLKRLVEIESPSTDKAAVDRLGAVVLSQGSSTWSDLTVRLRISPAVSLICKNNGKSSVK